MTIYSDLGVPEIINACGTVTRLSGGLMAPEVAEAMRQAQPRASEAEGLALLVSCIGRRLLMGQRAVNEVEAAAEAMAVRHALIGFYSDGEISPHAQSGFAQLHNQTMTVVTVSETSDEA